VITITRPEQRNAVNAAALGIQGALDDLDAAPELALSCDLLVAAKGAKLGQPEVKRSPWNARAALYVGK
jgi:enoyl-CoA hydratase/carnithine racemase